jgi:hypothetical protein
MVSWSSEVSARLPKPTEADWSIRRRECGQFNISSVPQKSEIQLPSVRQLSLEFYWTKTCAATGRINEGQRAQPPQMNFIERQRESFIAETQSRKVAENSTPTAFASPPQRLCVFAYSP